MLELMVCQKCFMELKVEYIFDISLNPKLTSRPEFNYIYAD